MDQRMPFGMFKGRRLAEVPIEYLRWLAGRPDLWTYLRTAVEAEIRRRRIEPPSDWPPSSCPVASSRLALDIIDAGRRSLARTLHPDVGGDHELMAAVNDAADRLRTLARSLRR
jgi:hypothetical protein